MKSLNPTTYISSSLPTLRPTESISFSVTTTCYVEKIVGQGDFTVPCDEIDEGYFESSARPLLGERVLISTNETSDEFARDMNLTFYIENTGNEVLEINTFTATLKGVSYVLLGVNNDLIVEPNETLMQSAIFFADLSNYGTESLVLKTVIIITSGETKDTLAFPADYILMSM